MCINIGLTVFSHLVNTRLHFTLSNMCRSHQTSSMYTVLVIHNTRLLTKAHKVLLRLTNRHLKHAPPQRRGFQSNTAPPYIDLHSVNLNSKYKCIVSFSSHSLYILYSKIPSYHLSRCFRQCYKLNPPWLS